MGIFDTLSGIGTSIWEYASDFDFSDDDPQGEGLAEGLLGLFESQTGDPTSITIGGTSYNPASLLGAGTGIAQLLGVLPESFTQSEQLNRPVGYQGGIPQYTATRTRKDLTNTMDVTDPETGLKAKVPRRPGSGGRRYFSDTTFTPKQMNRGGIAGGIANILPKPRYNLGGGVPSMTSRYLGTAEDGMADTIPASIDGKDPAALAGGEFVVAADVVSGLGNGNSEAGAKELYNMMDRVRQARTGTTKQGKEINPQQMMMV
jgi:hypothetical protein